VRRPSSRSSILPLACERSAPSAVNIVALSILGVAAARRPCVVTIVIGGRDCAKSVKCRFTRATIASQALQARRQVRKQNQPGHAVMRIRVAVSLQFRDQILQQAFSFSARAAAGIDDPSHDLQIVMLVVVDLPGDLEQRIEKAFAVMKLEHVVACEQRRQVSIADHFEGVHPHRPFANQGTIVIGPILQLQFQHLGKTCDNLAIGSRITTDLFDECQRGPS
jgi:hypothetical protein